MRSTLRSSQLASLILFQLALALIQAGALPLRVRQNATTVQTVHTTQTIAGPMIETCVVTLTPITDKDGDPAVEEVKVCTLAYAVPGPGGACTTGTSSGTKCGNGTSVSTTFTATVTGTSTPNTGSATTTTSLTSTGGIKVNGLSTVTATPGPTSTPATSSTLLTSATTTTTSANSTLTTSSSTTSSSTALTGSGLVVNGLSTVTGTPTPTTSSPTGTSTSTTTSGPSPSGTLAPAVSSASSVANTSTAEQQASTAAAFELPGQKLSVLPIGLGVFAGISVIALIVVGLVTYERTKYRKAFRQRKLEEMGGPIGYTQR